MAELIIVVLLSVVSYYSREVSCNEAPTYVSTEVEQVVQEGDLRPSP